MQAFARLLDALSYQPARNGKLRLIEAYLRDTPDPDRGWALAALTGGLDFPAAKPALLRSFGEERIGAEVPLDAAFRDEKEESITLRQAINGKPTILALVYYRCPQLCTMVLNDLLDAMRKMPPDFTAGQKFKIGRAHV